MNPSASLALKRNSLPVDRAGSTQPPSGFSTTSGSRVAQSATHTPIPNPPPPPALTAAALALASSGGLLSTVTPPFLQLPGPGTAAQEHRRSDLAVARAPSRERPPTDSLAGTRESDFQPSAGFAGHSHHKSTKVCKLCTVLCKYATMNSSGKCTVCTVYSELYSVSVFNYVNTIG